MPKKTGLGLSHADFARAAKMIKDNPAPREHKLRAAKILRDFFADEANFDPAGFYQAAGLGDTTAPNQTPETTMCPDGAVAIPCPHCEGRGWICPRLLGES